MKTTIGLRLIMVMLAVASTFYLSANAQEARRQREHAPPNGTMTSELYPSSSSENGLRVAATALNEQRTAAFRRHDPAAVVQLFTPDAVYVELLPRLQVMRGRAEIRQHYEELLAAESSNLAVTVIFAEASGEGLMSVGGDYVLTVRNNKQIQGHFFQMLRRDDGVWKIAMQTFARPEPVTVGETDSYRGN